MSNPRLALACTLLALAACGDNQPGPEAGMERVTVIPPVPPLGVQIDRAGRPVISTLLVGIRDVDPGMKRDAYNAASDPAMWATAELAAGRTIVAELAASLAILDVLDQNNPAIPGTTGCRNQLLYNGNPMGGGLPDATSYTMMAEILTDDMIYVDTTKTSCNAYFALEFDEATGAAIPHTECGGRTPRTDVIDVTYSALLSGLFGFTLPPGPMVPRIRDGVDPHTDLSDTAFPYFGPAR